MKPLAPSYNFAGIAVVLLGALLLAACSSSSDEEQVRAVIDAAEAAAEARSTSKVLDLVADDYVDSQSFDKAQLQQFLRAYFLTHPKIELAINVSGIEFETATRARARVDILMVGTQRSADSEPASLAGEKESLQVEFMRQASGWRVTRADRITK